MGPAQVYRIAVIGLQMKSEKPAMYSDRYTMHCVVVCILDITTVDYSSGRIPTHKQLVQLSSSRL